jgi:hypothetical protein
MISPLTNGIARFRQGKGIGEEITKLTEVLELLDVNKVIQT